MTYNAITVTRGSSGYGGPLTIKAEGAKNKIVYIVGGGAKPEVVEKMEELSGMESVNGFNTTVPDEEMAVAVIDCGGTLRCGLYPKKGIPTVNVMPTGKAGPLAQFINESIYVSAVGPDQVSLADPDAVPAGVAAAAATADAGAQPAESADAAAQAEGGDEVRYSSDMKVSESLAKKKNKNLLEKIGLGAGKVIAIFYQAGRDAIQTMITTILPFMGFVAMLIGIIQGSGLGNWISQTLSPLVGSGPGLLVLGFICSLPFLSPLLGPGGVIGQVIGTLIGVEIGKGAVSPSLALPALFAINTQNGCDFIPVALGLAEAEAETVEIGVPAVLYSRFVNGVPRVAVAWLASIGLYTSTG
ncbi:MAG: PTS sorbitol transporter subunit IIB [Propionibacteriaceae bacterium]|uniref:Protein-Npi-phosphohistidine-sugar phosphotransferase n=1 Tax=Propionibacterium ruminifibrarum TaxID=1962131 RepID=A0A375I4D4_9ACTN|nr:glucitol/sorbitol-specific PTS transporter subunit IIBC [Propionibacterium ruminifibrarum]MBE6476854.1 PTS sorbitol transporter subunit IIB [Propionibacteriaceae bacterium]SPF68195.1 protein-Npi-phosphohistidine-sugar phosphotransferase [Propionibacterium ruminifibrarum]